MKNPFTATVPCGETKSPRQRIYHLWPSVAALMEMLFASVSEAHMIGGRETHAQAQCSIGCVYCQSCSTSLPYGCSVLLSVSNDPRRVHPSALPVDTAIVAQGRCLSLSLPEHRRSSGSRWPGTRTRTRTHVCNAVIYCEFTQLCVQLWPCAGLSTFLYSSSVTQDARPVIHSAS